TGAFHSWRRETRQLWHLVRTCTRRALFFRSSVFRRNDRFWNQGLPRQRYPEGTELWLAFRNQRQSMGRSRGGLTSKIHPVVDSNGLPCDAGSMLMHADNGGVDHLDSGIMGKRQVRP